MYPRLTPLLLLALLLALSGSPLPVRAAGVVGTGTPASCTEAALRAAVSGGGLVTFSCGDGPVTITLADELVITKDTEIDGGGPVQGGRVTLSGGGRTRVLATGGAHLTVRNLTVANGKEPGADGRGGAIRGGWRSPVTVVNSVLRDNDGTAGGQEAGGGAIFVHETTLTVTDSRFVGNRGINGGAINNLLSSLTVTGSSFEQNDSTPGGLEGSLARGAGMGCPEADQRGMGRPASGCDSGAYQTGTVPVVVAVSPSMVERGTDTTLVVTGADFAPGSEVLWNGAPLATTYGSPFQLVVLLPVGRLGVGSSGEVRVRAGSTTSVTLQMVRLVDSLTRVALPLVRR